jgi:hypothetical protein
VVLNFRSKTSSNHGDHRRETTVEEDRREGRTLEFQEREAGKEI